MTWAIVAASAASATIGAGTWALNKDAGPDGGGGGGGGGIELPPFQADPYYKNSQDVLFPLGKNVLEGNIPDYYAPIGEIGGGLFEDVLGRSVRDVTKSTMESAIARGAGRGGPLSSSIAKNAGDVSSNMRYNDFLRALGGRGKLLEFGGNTLSGVRSSALENQSQVNNYAMRKALDEDGIESDADAARASKAAANQSAQTDIWGSLLGSVGSMMGAGSQSYSPTEIENIVSSGQQIGSAEKSGIDWASTGMDIAKIVAMFYQ